MPKLFGAAPSGLHCRPFTGFGQSVFRTSIALLLALLGGCGGGSGGGSASSGSGSEETARPPVPVAAFTADPISGEAPLVVAFDGSASGIESGSISHAWAFGDGRVGTGIQTSHTYPAPGTFEARLTVTSSANLSDTTTRTITVTGPPEFFRVSGTIRIAAATAVDSDTNDPNAPFASNDSCDAPQEPPLPNPVTVGGYVALPGAGPEGEVQARGDVSDFYQITARGGETVRLVVGSPGSATAPNDLDLYLYDRPDSGCSLVDSSMGTGAVESLTIPEAGSYLIEVRAASGASTYVLSVGSTRLAGSGLRARDDFVPGQMLLGPDTIGRASGTPAPVPLQIVATHSAGRARVAELPRRLTFDPLATGSNSWREALARSRIDDAALRIATLEAVKAVRHSGQYEWVEPNYLRRRQQLSPDDQLFPNQWHYRSIQLPFAWALTTGSPDVHVAVIDTGVLLDHPDLADQLVEPGYDFIRNSPGASDPGDGSFGDASSFHGTHVAGTVAARTDNRIGTAGTAWQSRVLPIRILGPDGGTSGDLMEALRYAAKLPNRSATEPARAVDIINLSLGGGGRSDQEQALLDDLRARGIFVVAAAGNQGSDVPFYPASYHGVLAVSATTITDEAAFYSNFGPQIDLAAPGGDVSTDVDGDGFADGVISALGDDTDRDNVRLGYGILAGTSMAAPHVAGVIALMKSEFPGLTPDQFDGLLQAGAITDDLGPDGRDDRFGYGLINAVKAVRAARELAGFGDDVPAILVANPSSLSFDPFTDRRNLRIGNAGNQRAELGDAFTDAPWLSVTATDIDEERLGTYRVTVDRDGLEDGLFQATVNFPSSSNTLRVPVKVQVASASQTADAGFHYIVLADADTGEIVDQVTSHAVTGSYPFLFEDIPAGRYELYAGTDMNNNFLVCDAGEACAIFPTIDAPEAIVLDQDRFDLEMITGFRAALFDAQQDAQGAAGSDRTAPGRARRRLETTP